MMVDSLKVQVAVDAIRGLVDNEQPVVCLAKYESG
jgi:hypothetical protein